MTDPVENVWQVPATPPPSLFLGDPERNLVKQVNDEIAEKIIGQQILYFPIDIQRSHFNIYGECLTKNFCSPVQVFCYVEFNQATEAAPFIDRRTEVKIFLQSRRLTEDKNLYVRAGDFVQYGTYFFEIAKVNEVNRLFGQVNHKFTVEMTCVYSREGVFDSL